MVAFTLLDYFEMDAKGSMQQSTQWPITNKDKSLGEVTARVHLNLSSQSKHVSFYIPDFDCDEYFEPSLLNEIRTLLDNMERAVGISWEGHGEKIDASKFSFTGVVYFYSERPVPYDLKIYMTDVTQKSGLRLSFRSVDYVVLRNKAERPRAFISHDSRDKSDIANPIASKLLTMNCSVWYDEFTLNVGDSLRKSIEDGLKECAKCVLILTPNMLANEGWGKREYDSIFTREIIEKERKILPVWHGVTVKQVYEYSPILADTVGIPWSLGVDEVARKLYNAVDH